MYAPLHVNDLTQHLGLQDELVRSGVQAVRRGVGGAACSRTRGLGESAGELEYRWARAPRG